jgi:hypothetical protein
MTTTTRAGRAVLHAPGTLSPRKITVKCARSARVLWMALRATLDSDLPRQDLGTYREDGGNLRTTGQFFTWQGKFRRVARTVAFFTPSDWQLPDRVVCQFP